MQVKIYYHGLDNTPWMEQFISKRVNKINRYLHQSAIVEVNLKFENKKYLTSLSIHNLGHDYSFSAEGLNMFESFSIAIDRATRALLEHKQVIKDKINKKFHNQAVA